VAGSVEGLDAKNVTVIDEQGNLLTSPKSDANSAEASELQNYRRSYEEYLASKAQSMLDRALGPGKSVVKVSAVLDMDRMSETKEQFDAANRVARTEKTLSKSTTTPGETASAAAGTQSEETSEAAYDIPKTVRTVQAAPGNVKKLDVAVIVDPSTLDKDGKDATLTPQQLDDLGTIVKRAVGLDETEPRKDTFKLTAMSFRQETKPAADPQIEQQQKRQYYLQITKYASSILAAIIFVAFAGITLRRMSRAAPKPAQGPAGAPPLMEADLYSVGGNGQGQLRNRVKEVMTRNPEAAAKLLQRWIGEEIHLKKG